MNNFYRNSLFIAIILICGYSSLSAAVVTKTTKVILSEAQDNLNGFEKDDFTITSQLLYVDRENSIPETGELNKFWAFEYRNDQAPYMGAQGSMLRITDNRSDKATYPVKEIRLYGSTPVGSPAPVVCFPDDATHIMLDFARIKSGSLTTNPVESETNPVRYTFNTSSEASGMFTIFGNVSSGQTAYLYKIEIDYDALYSGVGEVDANPFDVVLSGDELSFSEEIASVTVYATSGNVVCQSSNLSSLPKGIYIVKAKSVSGKILTKKIAR